MKTPNRDHLQELVDLIVGLGDEARDAMGSTVSSPELKDDGTTITQVDLNIERALRDFLTRRFPETGILGEEEGFSGRRDAPHIWVIDPLDGTTNYSLGLPIWAISVALLDKGRPKWGCVYVPVLKQLYLAELDRGATQNGVPIHGPQRDQMSREDCVGITSDGAKRYDYLFPQKIRSMGSAAAQAAFVASGYYVGYFLDEWHIWDIAAGILVAKEAGVSVTDSSGRVFDCFSHIGPKKGIPLLFSAPGIHGRLLSLITPKSKKL